jgi:general secretion pathway protein D
VTVQDGDTVAIGGIIQETNTEGSSGIPLLHNLPVVGPLFGVKTSSKERSELVIFLTPRVIYDTNQVTEATEELKDQMKKLKKIYRE